MKKEKNNVLKNIIIIIILFVFSIFILPVICKNLKFGLDLQGGFEVLYKVETIDGTKMNKSTINSTYKTLTKRIDALGVNEPEIIVEGNDKIRVKIAGVKNESEARKQLSTVATLSFRDTDDNLLMTSDILSSGGSKLSEDSSGNPAVSLSIKDKNKFYSITNRISKKKNNYIVIWLDYDEKENSFSKEKDRCGNSESNCLSAATVSEGFASDVIIQGNFTKEEAQNLVDLINSGSLPVKLSEISSKNVSASLGQTALDKTVSAGIIGVALIIFLMIGIYRFAGVISSIGIIIYSVLTLFIFWLIGGVLTLPGIAAIVIGIGMAIDANVITFSRIKDELKHGKNLKNAFIDGNKNSFVSIFDSNITTLLVAIILFIFGESSVKGFATMLIISIIITLIVMVVVVRILLKPFTKIELFNKKPNLFVGKIRNKDNKINFVKHRKKFYIITSIIMLIGVISLIFNNLNLGIDFKGGTSITINKSNNVELCKNIKNYGYKVYSCEKISKNTTDIRIKEELTPKEIHKVKKEINDKYKVSVDIGVVSNMVKKDLIKNMIFSILLSMIGIIVYVSIRFKFNYAISGLIALFHDAFMMVAFFSITGLEISNLFIAALLSIIGYSINDTIVAFDKIRENLKGKKIKDKKELEEEVDKGLNRTIGRSIITTLTTMLPIITMIIFGSYEIFNFNIALLVGLIAGTYSSIFIASQLWYDIESREKGK